MKNFRFEIGDALLPGGKLYELFAEAIKDGIVTQCESGMLLNMFDQQHQLFAAETDNYGITVDNYRMRDFMWMTPIVNLIEDIAKQTVNPEAIMNNREIIEFRGFIEDCTIPKLRKAGERLIFKRAPYYIMVPPGCVSVNQYITDALGPDTVIEICNRLYKNIQLAKRLRENIGPCKAKLKLICDKIRKIEQVNNL